MFCESSSAPPSTLGDLSQIARWRAERQSGEIAFTFLVDGENQAQRLTFGQLDSRARAIAATLQARGSLGARALILAHPGLEFVEAVFGCFYAGAIAVPVNPPDPLRLARTLPRFQAVLADCRAKFLLGSPDLLALVEGTAVEPVPLDAIDSCAALRWTAAGRNPRRPALLQYTSGSTGSPRGVILSHANLLHSLQDMHREDSDDVVGVTWLPPYHDFGLIAGTLLPVYSGRQTVTMSPLAFVQRPVRWLRAIARYRGTTTGGPNFAYELCTRKVSADDCEGLDLSSLRIAAVSAEPIRAETLERFSVKFAPYGFRREAFLPAYGLAEAVLNVTCKRWFESPVIRSYSQPALAEGKARPTDVRLPSSRRLVGCGRAWPGHRLAIVDPASRRAVADCCVGEVWVQSANVGQGYWHRAEETRNTFRARRADEQNGTWLRTGDLGFLDGGELFVVGRLKDLIVLGGRNFYPHDIEQVVARSHPALRQDEGVVFALEIDGQERMIVVQELRRTRRFSTDEIIRRIRQELAEEYLLQPYAVALVRGGSLPKTSSGKLQRRACCELYRSGKFDLLAEWRADVLPEPAAYVAPRTPLECAIAAIWAEVLHVERVGVFDHFFALGGSSLLAVELHARLRHLLPENVSLARLFEEPTVAGLAERILAGQVQEADAGGLGKLLDRLDGMSDELASELLAPGETSGSPADRARRE